MRVRRVEERKKAHLVKKRMICPKTEKKSGMHPFSFTLFDKRQKKKKGSLSSDQHSARGHVPIYRMHICLAGRHVHIHVHTLP